MKKNLILIILYNRGIHNSETLQCLQQNRDELYSSDLLIWDNSPLPAVSLPELQKAFSGISVDHKHTSENYGLSKIYNEVINNYLQTHNYLILLDHDTSVTKTYLQEINTLSAGTTLGSPYLLLPVIKFGQKIVSPARLYHFLGKYFEKLPQGAYPTKHLTAINSGMAISFDYFRESGFRYDEYLLFYGTDDYFMKKFQQYADECYILQSKIEHSLNYFDADEPIDKKAHRFREIMKGVIYLNRSGLVLKISAKTYVIVKAIRESIKHKSLKFLNVVWKS